MFKPAMFPAQLPSGLRTTAPDHGNCPPDYGQQLLIKVTALLITDNTF
jgi:hypothetical protein